MATITYNQLLKEFETMATNHKQLKRFGNGVIEDINTFTTNNGEFPILWVVPQGAVINENDLVYKVRVLIFDIDDTDDGFRDELLSDTLLMMNDIVQTLRNTSDNYEVTNNPQAIPFNQRFVDYCSGWYCDVDISTNINNSLCIIPMN